MKNTFDVEKTFQRMDEEFNGKGNAKGREIVGDYEIAPTGLDGWMSFRYQYKVGIHDYFGYAETVEEARTAILNAQEGTK